MGTNCLDLKEVTHSSKATLHVEWKCDLAGITPEEIAGLALQLIDGKLQDGGTNTLAAEIIIRRHATQLIRLPSNCQVFYSL